MYIPTATRPSIVLPGHAVPRAERRHLPAQRRLLHRPASLDVDRGRGCSPRTCPAPRTSSRCFAPPEYSNLYLLNSQGTIIRQLSNNATTHPRRSGSTTGCSGRTSAPTGNTLYFSYDQPKNSSDVRRRFLDLVGSARTASSPTTQLSDSNPFTGGDVDPTPMANGAVMYSRFAIGSGNAYSLIAHPDQAAGAAGHPHHAQREDCGQPAPSPDGTMVAMICIGGTGSAEHAARGRAAESATSSGPPRTLVNNCLCSDPEWAPDGSGLVVLQHGRRHRALRALVDQGRADRAPGFAAAGDHEPRLRRHLAAVVVAAERAVPVMSRSLVEDLRELVQLARHAALLRDDVGDARDLDRPAAHDRHLTEPSPRRRGRTPWRRRVSPRCGRTRSASRRAARGRAPSRASRDRCAPR